MLWLWILLGWGFSNVLIVAFFYAAFRNEREERKQRERRKRAIARMAQLFREIEEREGDRT